MKLSLDEITKFVKALGYKHRESFKEYCKANEFFEDFLDEFVRLWAISETPFNKVKYPRKAWEARIEIYKVFYANCLYRFLFAKTYPRSMNMSMIFVRGTASGGKHDSQLVLLAAGLQMSQTGDHPLHQLWFITMWKAARKRGDIGTRAAKTLKRGLKRSKAEREGFDVSDDYIIKESEDMKKEVVEINRDIDLHERNAIDAIRSRIEKAQAADFAEKCSPAFWWEEDDDFEMPQRTEIPIMGRGLLEELLGSLDPEEKSAFLKFAMPKDAPAAPMVTEIFDKIRLKTHELEEEEEETDLKKKANYLLAINKLGFALILYRSFHGPDREFNLLMPICVIESLLAVNKPKSALKIWSEHRHVFDYHIPPLDGLWLLDLYRQIIHTLYHKNKPAKELEWIHAQENELLEEIEAGNYTGDN